MVDLYGEIGDEKAWTAGTVVTILSTERVDLLNLVLGQPGFAIWRQNRSARRTMVRTL